MVKAESVFSDNKGDIFTTATEKLFLLHISKALDPDYFTLSLFEKPQDFSLSYIVSRRKQHRRKSFNF
jgi:hypothetical protein